MEKSEKKKKNFHGWTSPPTIRMFPYISGAGGGKDYENCLYTQKQLSKVLYKNSSPENFVIVSGKHSCRGHFIKTAE